MKVRNRATCDALERRAMLAAAWQADNGNGTFTNPVLYADYSDPDIVRVNDDFYMTASTFVSSPGLPILHSRDLVNWELVGHAASTVDGGNAYNMVGGTAYENGFWAPSIRYHAGTFYVAVQPTFANGRIYYSNNPAGPWSFYQLDRTIYDPGLFFDDDGTGYIVSGSGSLTLMTLNANYSAIASQKTNFLTLANGGEGSHMVKRGSYYYVFNANPGIWPFQLLVSRSTNLASGTWETNVALTATTGGHQGAIVDLPDATPGTLLDNQWFGFVHQDSGGIGRMPRIGPVFWENNWPVFGTTTQRDVIADTYAKPIGGQPITVPASSDAFGAGTLGQQWAWNHNPDNTRWSLTERPGYLRLRPTQAAGFWTARNTLTQKTQGPTSHGIVKLDLSSLQPGDVAGFGTLGKVAAQLAITVDALGNKTLGMVMRKDDVGSYVGASGVAISGNTIYLRTDLDFTKSLGVNSFSTDGVNWIKLGGNFELQFGFGSTWQGEQFALFCYNPNTASSAGYLDVDSFTLEAGATMISAQRGRATLNVARTTFVADNGQLLRGPYESTEWTTAAPISEVAKIKELGLNTVHLYAESFDPTYPNAGSTAPGYAAAEVDKFVQMTRDLGLYLVITIGNGASNGSYNKQWVEAFWNYYAPRYANETHVLYEIQNEPVAWGPPYSSATATPSGAVAMEASAYGIIRAAAPNTPVLLFTYAVFGDTGGTAALTDIHAFNTTVFGNANAVWTNEAVAFHGYAGHLGTPAAVQTLLSSGYPAFMTEFISPSWGTGSDGQDVELTAELERLGVSWTTFLTIPPYGVSPDVTQASVFKDRIERAGIAWTPDFGNWPLSRSPFGNGGLPRSTTSTFVSNQLTGTTRIQAEDFDTGGQGVAYNDTSLANQGGQYRASDAVDIAATTDTGGGYAVSYIDGGEWLEYTVFVREPGYYTLNLRYATPNASAAMSVSANGKSVASSVSLASTGGFSTWNTSSRQVFLEYGQQKLRIDVATGDFDLNWIELAPLAAGAVATGTYKLVNRNSGLVMEFDTANNVVKQQASSAASTQQWVLQNLGAGQYKITSAFNTNSWNVGGGNGNELGMVWWWGVDARHQRYVIRSTGDGFYRIAPVDLGIDLEIKNASAAAGAPVVQDPYKGLASQQWAVLSTGDLLFPTNLIAARNLAGNAQLTWNAVAGASSYTVKRATSSGGPYTTLATNVTTSSYLDTTATVGTAYFYVVSAVGATGNQSLNSAEAALLTSHTHLRFDETAGTSAADASGNGWTGTLYNGPTWTTGILNKAVSLDGTNDYVGLPSGVVNGLTRATLAMWVKLDALANWARIFDFGTGTSNYMFLAPQAGDSGKLRFAITTGSGEQRIDAAAPLVTGQWVHVAVTLGDGVGILYVNGTEVGRNTTMTLTPASLGVTTNNYLGRSNWSDPYFDGAIDDFRIYDRALGASEIQALNVVMSNAAPTIASAATATPAAVTTTTTALNVLGSDDAGEAGLTYNWNVVGTPPGAVTFAVNGTNAAKTTIATFSAVGTYTLQATVTDAGGLSVTSTVAVSVVPTAASIAAVTPIAAGATVQMTALDQFGNAISDLGGFAWTSDVGSILQTGTFTAPVSGSGGAQIAFSNGTTTLTRTVSVVNAYAWYRADQISGPSFSDSSGNARNGSLSGAYSFSAGKAANALALTGGYASLPSGIVSGLTSVTIAAWVNLTSNPVWSRIFDFGTGTTANMFLTANPNNASQLRFSITTAGGGGEQQINAPGLSIGTWTHVAVTIAGGVGTIYINGVAAATNPSMTLTPASLGVTSNNYLGKSQYPDAAFQGRIDDFRIYGNALSASAIAGVFRSWSAPTVSIAAAATPSPVVGTSTQISVLGASDAGASGLIYTWSVVGLSPGSVTFDDNATNSARNTTARFTATGAYSLRVVISDASGASVASNVSLSVTMPSVISTVFNYRARPSTLSFTFNTDVGTQPWMSMLSVSGLSPAAATYSAATRTVVYTLPASIPDATYSAILSGSFLATPYATNFFVLTGDANHDGTVNFDDLLVLAQHYGAAATFDQGDLNADGVVNFDDLLLLAQHYGATALSQQLSDASRLASTVSATSAGTAKSTRRVVATFSPSPVIVRGNS